MNCFGIIYVHMYACKYIFIKYILKEFGENVESLKILGTNTMIRIVI
jgi:hypothetical protein